MAGRSQASHDKKIARIKAKALAAVKPDSELSAGETAAPTPNLPVPFVPVVEGELTTPSGDAAELTRTALKRAMRAKAQAHADKAIAVLVQIVDSKKTSLWEKRTAANDLLAWGFGKPTTEIEAGEGGQVIIIKRFGDPV